jgi:hypothetical protein
MQSLSVFLGCVGVNDGRDFILRCEGDDDDDEEEGEG